MKFRVPFRHSHQTRYIRLDTHHCEACWACIDACPKQVLGKVDVFNHRHVRLDNADACNGCKKCVRACVHHAIVYTYQPVPVEERKPSASRKAPNP